MSYQIYLLLKVFHVTTMAFFIGGMIFLNKCFYRHAAMAKDSECYFLMCKLERSLMKYVNILFICTVVVGLCLIMYIGGFAQNKWLHYKVFLVFILGALHGFIVKCYKKFIKQENFLSPLFFKILNFVLFFIIFAIICLAVIKNN